MELRRRTWIAALKLALVISMVAAIVAIAASSAGEVNEIAIVLPVIVVAFVASWVQTARIRRHDAGTVLPASSVIAPTA